MRSNWKHFIFYSEIFQPGFHPAFYVSIRTFWGKILFMRKLGFMFFSAQTRRKFELLSEKFRTGCQACLQFVHRNTLKVKKLIENIYAFHVWTVKKKSGFASKIHRLCCQNCILSVHWKFLSTNRIFGNNQFSSNPENRRKMVWVEKFPAVLSKCIKHVHRSILSENECFLKALYFLYSRTWSKNHYTFC